MTAKPFTLQPENFFMEYNKLIAISALSGLYELVSNRAGGAVVRSLDDNSTKFVSNRIHQFSHLEGIEVYTVRENVNLIEVLKAMQASTEKLPDEKDAKAVKNYFKKVYADLDFNRVYASDMKKMIKWLSIINAHKIELKLDEGKNIEEEKINEEKIEEKEIEKEEKPQQLNLFNEEIKEVKETKPKTTRAKTKKVE